MANICTQTINFITNGQDQLDNLLKHLVNNDNKINNKENLATILNESEYFEKNYILYAEINNNELKLTTETRWTPYYDFVDDEFFVENSIDIYGYAEEPGCSIYETYSLTNGDFTSESYEGTIRRLEFYEITNQDDLEYTLFELMPTLEYTDVLIPASVYELLNSKRLQNEYDNLINKEFNNYSLLSLVLLDMDLCNFSKEETNIMIDLCDKDLLVLITSESYINFFNKYGEVYIDDVGFPLKLTEVLQILIDNDYITSSLLNEYLKYSNKDIYEIKNHLYDLYKDSNYNKNILTMTDEKYCNKIMLMEKKMLN